MIMALGSCKQLLLVHPPPPPHTEAGHRRQAAANGPASRFGGDVFLDDRLLIQINPRILLLHCVHRSDRRRKD